MRDVTLTGSKDTVQQVKKPLGFHFRNCLPNGLANIFPLADDTNVGFINEFKNMLGPAQDRDNPGARWNWRRWRSIASA